MEANYPNGSQENANTEIRAPKPIVSFAMLLAGSLPYLADQLVSPRLHGFSSTFVYPLAQEFEGQGEKHEN